MHKNKPAERFIAGSRKCSTTHASRILSDILKSTLRGISAEDEKEVRSSGIRRCFVVESFETVAAFLDTWTRGDSPVNMRRLYTFDFSTMYTTLPHADLKARINQCVDDMAKIRSEQPDDKCTIDEVYVQWEWPKSSNRPVVEWVKRTRRYKTRHDSRKHIFSLMDVKELIAFVIDNTYVVNAGIIRRQTVGIPMGTNCAPYLANLYLYQYEKIYIDKLCHEGNEAEARSSHLFFRYIDDGLMVDSPMIPRLNEIYPNALSWNDTSVTPENVNFLGMNISSAGDGFEITVYDKRRDFPFRVILYPHASSCIPTSIRRGTFTGLLHRYHRICSHWEHFAQNAGQLMSILLSRSYSIRELSQWLKAFLHRNKLRYTFNKQAIFKRIVRTEALSANNDH
jgi:hypothetical protein